MQLNEKKMIEEKSKIVSEKSIKRANERKQENSYRKKCEIHTHTRWDKPCIAEALTNRKKAIKLTKKRENTARPKITKPNQTPHEKKKKKKKKTKFKRNKQKEK